MKLIWLPDARSELREILAYIGERNPDAAERLSARIEYFADRLTATPYIHRPGRVGGTREAVVHPNYLIIYRVAEDTIWILSVVHARQQYP